MNANNAQRKTGIYLLLLALQILGAITFVWRELPEFRQVVSNLGEQIPSDDLSDLLLVGILLVMQGAFWCRVRLIPMPIFHPNAFLQHLFLFLGKLSFIFGSALFGVVVFRHLPELAPGVDFFLMAKRGVTFVGCLFALFCTSLEVERLGQAFERGHRH
jgi:hypothetical protein